MLTITGINKLKDSHYKKNLNAAFYPFGINDIANFCGEDIDIHMIVGNMKV